MPTLKQSWQLLTHLGPGWVVFRMRYAWRRKSGGLRRASPMGAWEQIPVPELALARPEVPVRSRIGEGCLAEAEAILSGKFRLFSHQEVDAGFPPDWQANQLGKSVKLKTEKLKSDPLSSDFGVASGGQKSEVGWRNSALNSQVSSSQSQNSAFSSQLSATDSQSLPHWSEFSDHANGDIKGVWELNRLGWVYPLVRAWAKTGDPRFTDGFGRLLTDWCERNPPNKGANWMCGQEATFRLMAVIFAAERLPIGAETREHVARLTRATALRIAANLDYALSQKNNHGISECVGLITAALVLWDLPEADRWLALGLSKLQAQCSELVYADGSFSQHSLIYHRVLLHDICWLTVRLRQAKQPVPAWLCATGCRALDFLTTITDPKSGEAPLFGSNDGANILPLADEEFLDMRSTIQLTSAVFRSQLPLPEGPWDEPVEWLVGECALLPRIEWSSPPERWDAPNGGYLQLSHGNDRLFMRCPTQFRHRPAQADMLHVDLVLGGRSVAVDGGSFSYNSTERFTALAKATHHNVLTVDRLEPLQKFGRFLYLPWPHGRSEPTTDGEGWQASHDGYAHLGVAWTREVRPTEDGWRVIDRVRCDQPKTLRWHWRLADTTWKLYENTCRCDFAVLRWGGAPEVHAKLVRADVGSAYGWRSSTYGTVQPAVSLILDLADATSTELILDFTRPVA